MALSGHADRLALVGETHDDVRQVMVEGRAGLLEICPPHERPLWQPSRRLLTWPNGARTRCYSATDPDQLRGPEHHLAWCDEIAKWPYEEAWNNMMLGLRIGDNPRVVATTTPRPKAWLMALAKESDVIVTTGATAENKHLAPGFMAAMNRRYGHSSIGRQELEGQLLTHDPDALWQRQDLIVRRQDPPARDQFKLIVIGVDPALGGGDETGIIVAGRDCHGLIWVLEDASIKAAPNIWAARIVQASKRWRARRLVVEINQGGNLVTATLRANGVHLPVQQVRATQGKILRAEPVAAAYGAGRVFHGGCFAQLEDQMCACVPGQRLTPSPDRLDAMVWAVTTLLQHQSTTSEEILI